MINDIETGRLRQLVAQLKAEIAERENDPVLAAEARRDHADGVYQVLVHQLYAPSDRRS